MILPKRRLIVFVQNLSIIMILLIVGGVGNDVAAQTYVNPTAPPPGGRAATFLDTSAVTQLKLGSLFIGRTTSPKYFCLNAISSFPSGISQADKDAGYCINSWSSLIAGGLLPLYTNQFAVTGASPPFPIAEKYLDAAGTTTGYLRVKGASSLTTIITTADAFPLNTTTAFYGDTGSSPQAGSFAAYFNGRLKVDDISGLSRSGSLCLGSNTFNPSCTARFTDLCATCTGRSNYNDQIRYDVNNPPAVASLNGAGTVVHNQSARLTKETGAGTYGGSWQFDSAVVGGVTNLPTNKSYCLDGYCSKERGEDLPADGDYCPSDCGFGFGVFPGNILTSGDPGVIVR